MGKISERKIFGRLNGWKNVVMRLSIVRSKMGKKCLRCFSQIHDFFRRRDYLKKFQSD